MKCPLCESMGFSRAHATSRIVTPDHITHAYVEDVRSYVQGLRSQPSSYKITCGNFRDFITDTLRDIDKTVKIVDRSGQEAKVSLKPLEFDSVNYWVRDYLFAPRLPLFFMTGRNAPRLRDITRARIASIATVLKASDPHSGAIWGMRAANDLDPQLSGLWSGKATHPKASDSIAAARCPI